MSTIPCAACGKPVRSGPRGSATVCAACYRPPKAAGASIKTQSIRAQPPAPKAHQRPPWCDARGGGPVPPCPGAKAHRYLLPDRVPVAGVGVACENEGCGHTRTYFGQGVGA